MWSTMGHADSVTSLPFRIGVLGGELSPVEEWSEPATSGGRVSPFPARRYAHAAPLSLRRGAGHHGAEKGAAVRGIGQTGSSREVRADSCVLWNADPTATRPCGTTCGQDGCASGIDCLDAQSAWSAHRPLPRIFREASLNMASDSQDDLAAEELCSRHSPGGTTPTRSDGRRNATVRSGRVEHGHASTSVVDLARPPSQSGAVRLARALPGSSAGGH